MDSGDSRGAVLEEGAGHAGIRTSRAMVTAIDTAKAEGRDLPEL